MRWQRIITGAMVLGLLLGCEIGKSTQIPATLIGRWTSSAPAFEDRFMEFKPSEVRFGTGGGDSTAHPISGVEEVWEGENILYTITYLFVDGGDSTLSLQYEPASRLLRLQNRPAVKWARDTG